MSFDIYTNDLIEDAEKSLSKTFLEVDNICIKNEQKVLKSMIDNNLVDADFNPTDGYGYSDLGRDKIDKIYASIFNTEDALVRFQIPSATSAISLALFSMLLPGDEFISSDGMPYDTLHSIIGINNDPCSLSELGCKFSYVDLLPAKYDASGKLIETEKYDIDKILNKITDKTKLVMFQRSKGYTVRHSFMPHEIGSAIKKIKEKNQNIICMVDNCYGTFVCENEPSDFGADIVIGSLIKNAGGGITDCGAYIVGKKDFIERCSFRLTAPGIGKEVGASLGFNKNILKGLYFAPRSVANAVKTQLLFSKCLECMGYKTYPNSMENRSDIITAIEFGNKEKLENFTTAIQKNSPVNSNLRPIFDDMPGYDSKVIMAAGCFVAGASLELSADAPLKAPYIVYLQGGVNYGMSKMVLANILDKKGV